MPQRYNMGTPGVEAGDLQAILEQMSQMMAEGEDPFKRVDPWQAARPSAGPPGMPIPAEPNATRSGPDLGPKPLDRKGVERPNKYAGDVDSWLSWSKSFRKFLRRTNVQWPDLLSKVESRKGKPVTASAEAEWSTQLGLGPMEAWKD